MTKRVEHTLADEIAQGVVTLRGGSESTVEVKSLS
jgi:hypothetical protein